MEAMAGTRPLGATLRSRRFLRMAPDDHLVALVRQGDERAFEAIYDRHHRGILAFCRHMLGSQHEAEDAVQHTFLAAYNDVASSDKPIQLKAWLYTIARNRCLSMLRARRERPVEDLDDAQPSTEGLAAQVQRRHDVQELLRDLHSLPEDQRAALVLAEIGDLPHTEIASVLDVRKDKVKALVFQARESLATSRQARETPCVEVREQLATMRGGALRRAPLRRHLRDCPGCSAFRTEVQRQRAAMAVLLPVIPSAGLKAASLPWSASKVAAAGSAGAGGAGVAGSAASGVGVTASGGAAGGAAAAGATGGVAAGGAAGGVGALVSGTAAKVLVVAAVAGTAAGGAAGVEKLTSDDDPAPAKTSLQAKGPSDNASPTAKAPTPPRSEKAQGVLPERRAGKGGNSERARERAQERRAERAREKRQRAAATREKERGGGRGKQRGARSPQGGGDRSRGGNGGRPERAAPPPQRQGGGNAGGNAGGRADPGTRGNGGGNRGGSVIGEIEVPLAPKSVPVPKAPKGAGPLGE